VEAFLALVIKREHTIEQSMEENTLWGLPWKHKTKQMTKIVLKNLKYK
jgi:hypothetical protein